jgi:hypothetical protein
MVTWRAVALVLLLMVAIGSEAAEPGSPEQPYEVTRTTSEITIDGAIDEPAWNDALTLELEYEVQPGENVPPPVRTQVLITYDAHRVLVAFRAFDPDPERIRARFRDRDHAWQDDWVGIVLDTFNDERRAFEFISNPLGVQTDAINDNVNNRYDIAWDAIWESAGRLTDLGYEVEIAIPFNQLRFQNLDGPQIWGVDAVRSYPRVERHHIGLFPRERGANSYLAQEDKMIGFEAASVGRNLELVPTLTATATQQRPDFPDSTEVEDDKDGEVGITGTWGVTPNLTLTGALNPDFSQVEADAVQLAINTRFALFFPEKRPFFLESADYFDSGLNLLYTRMIADPSAALKLTGKFGPHTVGLFTARDEITNVIVPGPQGSSGASFDEPNTSTVGRYRFNLGTDSIIGAVFTDREGSDGYFNRVVSADGVFRPTDADKFTVDAALSRTRYSQAMQEELEVGSETISGHALNLKYVRTQRKYFIFAEYADLGDDFRADLGFIPQVGYRELEGGAGYLWWGDDRHFYNRLEVGGLMERSEEQDGELLEQKAELWFDFAGPRESFFHVELGTRDIVFDGVRFDDLFVPVVFVRVRPSSKLFVRVFAVGGDWIDFDNVRPADRIEASSLIGLDLGRHLLLEFVYTYSALDVEGGPLFEANVPEMKVVWQFNTRTFVRAIFQYTDITRNPDLYDDEVDALSRDLFVQLLFSYKVNPRTVFFLGYSETGIETQDFSLTTTDRTLFLKLGYSWIW